MELDPAVPLRSGVWELILLGSQLFVDIKPWRASTIMHRMDLQHKM